MSDVWFNIRFGPYHFQVKYGSWFSVEKSKNNYWSDYKWVKSPIGFYDFKLCENIKYIKCN